MNSHSRNSSESYPFKAQYSAKRIISAACLALLVVLGLFYLQFSYNDDDNPSAKIFHSPHPSSTPDNSPKYSNPSEAAYHSLPNSHLTSTLVLGTLEHAQSKLTWLDDLTTLTSPPTIYVVDNATTTHPHLPRNRGREAAVYLAYIIKHYDDPTDPLKDVTIFWHPDETSWHNNLLLSLSSTAAINKLSRAAVLRKGYVNARCDAWPGCPSWIPFSPTPAEHALHPSRMADGFTVQFFKSKFPNDPLDTIPRYFANACCSQFAVSRDAILSRPVQDYQRLYDWLVEDPFDQLTGRMMEYLWPWLFTKKGQHCPDVGVCYCENFGVCLTEGGEEERLLRGWMEGYRRTEELGEGMGTAVREKQRLAVESWKVMKGRMKSGGGLKQKDDDDDDKAAEEAIKTAAEKKYKATDEYKKMHNEQWLVWGKAKDCRKKLAQMMGLKNEAGDQRIIGLD